MNNSAPDEITGIDKSLLPPAVKGGKTIISPDGRAEIAKLMGARPLPFTFQLIFAWFVIIGAIIWATWMNTIWASILAVIIVATRQNILGLLVHEQAHVLGYRSKYGDLLVNLFAAFPLMVLTVQGYAQVHLAHHRDFNLATDPDFIRKSGKNWSIPKTTFEIVKILLIDITGFNTLKLISGKNVKTENMAFARRHKDPVWIRPLYFILVAIALTYFGGWRFFLLYWALPAITVTQAINTWGAICEHKYNLSGASVADSTPLIIPRWWEKILMPDLNFSLHPYHHYFPGVSFSLLPKVHEIYCREGILNQENVFLSNFSFFKFITSHKKKNKPIQQ
jgi:fatty acid desaturase